MAITRRNFLKSAAATIGLAAVSPPIVKTLLPEIPQATAAPKILQTSTTPEYQTFCWNIKEGRNYTAIEEDVILNVKKFKNYTEYLQRYYTITSDFYFSPDAFKGWGIDEIDELTRKELYACL